MMKVMRAKAGLCGAAVGLALLASGCASKTDEAGGGGSGPETGSTSQSVAIWWDDLINHGKWKQIRRPDGIQVEQISLSHPVAFEFGKSELSPQAIAELRAFLAEGGVSAGDFIEIDGPRANGSGHSPLTSARLESVRRELSRLGFSAKLTTRPGAFDPAQEAVSIAVNRYLFIPPDCSRPLPANRKRNADDMGCATISSLSLMVVHPQDLHHGRPLGPEDGTAAAATIQRYREGEIEEIEEAETTDQ